MRLIKGIVSGLLLELIPLVVVLWLLHIIGVTTAVQIAALAAAAVMVLGVVWQAKKTERNADLAAALARGQGTYIIGDKQIRHGNVKPIADRIGVPLAGVQPGAIPRNPDTGMPLYLGTSLPTPPDSELVNVEGWGVRQHADGSAHFVPPAS